MSRLTRAQLFHQPCWGRYKAKSHATHSTRDLPWVLDPARSVEVVLLGDGLLERLLWYGHGRLKAQLPPNVMVAAVSGDAVDNLLYRLESPAGLLWHLHKRNQTRKVVVCVGSDQLCTHAAAAAEEHDDDDDATNHDVVAQDAALDRVVRTLARVLQTIRLYLPEVALEVWGLPWDANHQPQLGRFNEKLMALCARHQACYVDDLPVATNLLGTQLWQGPEKHQLNIQGYQLCVLPAVWAAAQEAPPALVAL